MNCPHETAVILLDILGLALLRARAAAWGSDARQAALEADHVHNLPGLLGNYSPDGLRYYWTVEVPSFVERCREANIDSKGFEPMWQNLRCQLENLKELTPVKQRR